MPGMTPPDILHTGPWAAVIDAARAAPGYCAAHRLHRPRPLALHRHHIWPLGMHGPDEPWNTLSLCPTAHVNVHLLLKVLHTTGQVLRGGHAERRIAQLGYRLWSDAGRPGGRVTLADDQPPGVITA